MAKKPRASDVRDMKVCLELFLRLQMAREAGAKVENSAYTGLKALTKHLLNQYFEPKDVEASYLVVNMATKRSFVTEPMIYSNAVESARWFNEKYSSHEQYKGQFQIMTIETAIHMKVPLDNVVFK